MSGHTVIGIADAAWALHLLTFYVLVSFDRLTWKLHS